jgi:hypothetical protein
LLRARQGRRRSERRDLQRIPRPRWQHFWLMILFVGFFVIHIGQVALAGWSNFRSMVTGYEAVDMRRKFPPHH